MQKNENVIDRKQNSKECWKIVNLGSTKICIYMWEKIVGKTRTATHIILIWEKRN